MIAVAAEPLATKAAALLVTRDLAAGYNGRPAIEGVSMEVRAGERVALLGPNGGGKTTLFRTLLGELQPLRGSIDVLVPAGAVPQNDRSRLDYPVSALDVALMGTLARLPWWKRPGRRERQAALAALERVGLGTRAGESFGELSGGQRQRVLIARALVQDARLLLLDEPYSGLDTTSAERLTELLYDLAASGSGVVVATHDLEQAREYDRVLCLNHEQVAFGAPAGVLDSATLERTYGAAIVRLPNGSGHRGVLPPHHHPPE
jgi:ABC-type Mn2+/Zn2+ transport system ATPase subunit